MHRFRKRSDLAKSPVPFLTLSDTLSLSEEGGHTPHIPPLPLANDDFRTSLILPELSRRFSLLKSPNGDFVGFDVLRNKLAEQRAQGAENHVSEEEEDMILASLRFRSKPTTSAHGSADSPNFSGADRISQQSMTASESSLASSTSSSPTPKHAKRYSNNLFSSGRFRDNLSMRGVMKNGNSKAHLSAPSESSQSITSTSESIRPVTPESSAVPSSLPSSPNEKASLFRLAQSFPHGEQRISVAEYRISKTLGPAGVKRASLALEDAIKEIVEAEDEIVMPRSTPIPRNSAEHSTESTETGAAQASEFEPMAISSDKNAQDMDFTEQRASPIPSRTLPGYVPGMPRPMTPRDSDPDDIRSHSTTPRAISPASAVPTPSTPNRPRRDSAASQRSPTAPLFLQRSTNGRFTPDDRARSASPLSSPPYQPLTTSRPSTPSNVVWTVPGSNRKQSGHSRNGSWTSSSTDSPGRATPGLRSPSLAESPTVSNELASESETSVPGTFSEPHRDRSSSRMSGCDNASSIRAPRSPTPTQNRSRSPTSPTFPEFASSTHSIKRASKQNAPSNLFNLGPIPPLIFSPLVNSSRSSLESEGSSYHTWEGEERDRSLSLLVDFDSPKPAWHELVHLNDSLNPLESGDEDWDPEEYLLRHAGVRKSDFYAIQDKLVSTSIAREERPDRAASSLRRRRPSTSQSNYSVNGREHRVASPPPQVQTSPTPPAKPTPPIVTEKRSPVLDTDDLTPPSPGALRNRDLAKALFGKEEPEEEEHKSRRSNTLDTLVNIPATPVLTLSYSTLRNPSEPRLSQATVEDEHKLAQEVQQKMDAATQALKSPTSPSTSDLSGTLTRNGTGSRKRINTNQISNPRFVSASTSVETVPIVRSPSVSSSGASKIGSRFKKLRGTLRAKNFPPTGEDGTPDTSPSPDQAACHDPSKLKNPGNHSAPEAGFKVLVLSPPASAGPGLKGLMARLRGKSRVSDSPSLPEVHLLSQSQSPLTSPAPPAQLPPQIPSLAVEPPPNPLDTHHVAPIAPPISHQKSLSPEPLSSSSADSDETVLKQFLDAANKMGIDQGELSALLARKGSTSSRHLLNRSESMQRVETPVDTSLLISAGRANIDEQSGCAITPDMKHVLTGSYAAGTARTLRDRPSSRQNSRKTPDHVRRPPREGQVEGRAASAVLRRTIIFPESKMTVDELTTLMGKSSSGRRRGSVSSISGKSIHDRVPTPPPPRSPTSKRFSNGPSPPVPTLPPHLNVPAEGTLEKMSSTYDSLFDMYAGESRSPSATPHESEIQNEMGQVADAGAAVEVIELANGETIWNIVHGLRDEEEESVYNGRTSFSSEYSGDGGMQVVFKEHTRSGSKGSMSSFLSRQKSGRRPETKVFYSPSNNIGRLIEELSQGLDAGSFNFLPNPPSHSPSSSMSTSDTTWNLEERLDEMIQTVKAN